MPENDVVFDSRPSRRHGELTSLIKGYKGILQSDAYAAYAAYALAHPEVAWVGCWAHARRKFFEAQGEDPRLVRWILDQVGRMYHLEKQWDAEGIDTAQRRERRRLHFIRRLYWLRRVAIGLRAKVLPKSGRGKACTYLLGQWEPLCAHLDHGETRLDNNLMGNAIRPCALGKKNWLFIGHPDAGQRTAIIYSIVVSGQRRGIDPLAYLRDVLSQLPVLGPEANVDLLLPGNWKAPRRRRTARRREVITFTIKASSRCRRHYGDVCYPVMRGLLSDAYGLQSLDLGVEALGQSVGDAVLEVGQKTAQVGLEGASDLFDFGQAAAHDRAIPLGEKSRARGRAG
ncbi:MAG: transposase [Candidatus Synoicihabitans palmerolidicus]|nr:transposase [Candidatus Synoicihabitans palmerolidicus]